MGKREITKKIKKDTDKLKPGEETVISFSMDDLPSLLVLSPTTMLDS